MKIRIGTLLAGLACMALLAGCGPLQTKTDSKRAPHAQAPRPAAPPQPPAEPAEYRLGAGDVVKITVYDNPDLTTEAEIAQNGKIGFPLIGEVGLGGLSRAQAEQAISRSLASGGFIRNAHVNVMVATYRSQQVSVLGEVGKPGKYPVSQATSVTGMLAAAGGITPKASPVVIVTRKHPDGGTSRHQVNVRELLASGDLSADIRVDSDDVIYVPPAGVFYIYGEVRQPGAYPLVPDMTVRQALSVGGGLTVRGTERGIEVERRGPDGKASIRSVELNDTLKSNDVVRVPESWF